MRATLFCNGRSQAAVRPSARQFLELRDALLQEPGFREELDAFFEGLHNTSLPEPVDFP